jgi:phosphoesterase RecJ-like protein
MMSEPGDVRNSNQVPRLLRLAGSVWLTTHPQADGDGLACEAAMYLALKNMGKSVKIMNFEEPGDKYRFLFHPAHHQADASPIRVQVFDAELEPAPPDIIILFDTNDFRLIEPIIAWRAMLKEAGHEVPIVIIDHHQGEAPPEAYLWTDSNAASSGEVLHHLLRALNVNIDKRIAAALYASLVFDTQNFRFIRSSARSHKLAAELLPLIDDPEGIHEALFANLTPSKLGFLATALSALRIESEGTLAVVTLQKEIFHRYKAEANDSGDVIDMALNVNSVKIALLLREESQGVWKVSLRSKRGYSVLEAAQSLGGGGHRNAAGATVGGALGLDPQNIELKLRPLLLNEIRRQMAQ